MRYIWRDNVRLQHLGKALTSTTKLMEHLKVDVGNARKVGFTNDYRAGSSGESNEAVKSAVLRRFDFFSSPEAETVSGIQSELGSGDSRYYPSTDQFIHPPIAGNDGVRECKSEDFLSSKESQDEVKVKYETEPNAVGVKIEERGDGRAKEETVKMENRLQKEAKKEEIKEEMKEEGVEWDGSLVDWRVKSERHWSGGTKEARTSGSDGGDSGSGADGESGVSEAPREKNGRRSNSLTGEGREMELIESGEQIESELGGSNLCSLEIGGYVPPNARIPMERTQSHVGKKGIEFRVGSILGRKPVAQQLHKIKLAPGRPLGFRLISTRIQRRERSHPPNLRQKELRSSAVAKGEGGKREMHVSRGRSVVQRSLQGGQEKQKTNDRKPQGFRAHLPSNQVRRHSGDSRAIDRPRWSGAKMNQGDRPPKAIDFSREVVERRKQREPPTKDGNALKESGERRGRGGTPHRAVSRIALEQSRRKRNHPDETAQRKCARPAPKAMGKVQTRLLEQHEGIKLQAVRLWPLLGNPAYDAPRNPEAGFPAEAIAAAKR